MNFSYELHLSRSLIDRRRTWLPSAAGLHLCWDEEYHLNWSGDHELPVNLAVRLYERRDLHAGTLGKTLLLKARWWTSVDVNGASAISAIRAPELLPNNPRAADSIHKSPLECRHASSAYLSAWRSTVTGALPIMG